MRWFPVLLLLCFSCSEPPNETEVRIVFAGDLLLDRGIRNRIEHLGLESILDPSIDSVFAGADIVIANLECPATHIEMPINKQFIFRAEPEWLPFLKERGITHLNLANNHSMDQGRDGLTDTYSNIEKSGLIALGYGKNSEEACKPVILSSQPLVFLLSSLRVPSENWPYLPDKPCICEESIPELNDRVKRLKSVFPASHIIVQLHWGLEHTTKPTTEQISQAHSLINHGADCIIGHHSHTRQTTEHYLGKPVYYGIGNFIFDQANPLNTEGLLVELRITSGQLSTREIPISGRDQRTRVIK